MAKTTTTPYVVTKSTNVDVNGMFQEANFHLRYSFSGGASVQSVQCDANYNDGGASSSIYRTYDAEGNYTPVAKHVIYPFDEAFDAEMKRVVLAIVADPENPVF